MDDFEKAILFSFDQSGAVDAQLKAQAHAYCQHAKDSPQIWRVCLERYPVSQYGEVQFWCLQVLEDVVKSQYSALSSSDRQQLRSTLTTAICSPNESRSPGGSQCSPLPSFVKNKVAQIVVLLIYGEYPSEWPSIFLDMIASLGKGPDVVDMVLRVLTALDEEIISLDYPRSQEENMVSMRVKDAMRQQCVNQLVDAWYSLVVSYEGVSPELSAAVLETMQRYIAWIDIGLVANERWVPLFFRFLSAPDELPRLRTASADCVLAMVSKRMEAMAKLSLLQQLQMRQLCRRLPEINDSEFALKLTSLFTGLANELLDCCKKIDSNDSTNLPEAASAASAAREMLDEVLPIIFFFMEHEDEEISSSTFQFLLAYVGKIKRSTLLSPKQHDHLARILSIIRSRMRYDSYMKEPLDLPDEEGQQEEIRMGDYRKDLFTLLRNISKVAPDVTKLFVQSTIAMAFSKADAPFEDVEAAVALLYQLGEGITEDDLKPGSGSMAEMAGSLLSASVPHHSHRLISLTYLECLVRYIRFVEQNPQYIPPVLSVLLGGRGLHHLNSAVSSRASYLLMRIVKVLRLQLLPYADSMLQNLEDILVAVTTPPVAKGGLAAKTDGVFDERIYTYEAVGLLVGLEEISPEKQSKYVSAILVPLCSKVDSIMANEVTPGDVVGSPEAVWAIQQVILAISYFSKGFGEQLTTERRPEIGAHFKQALDMVLRVLQKLPKSKGLRSRAISFLHRMVETLGSSVFPYLPTAIQQLLLESEAKDIVEFLQLVNQLVVKFKAAMSPIVVEVLTPLLARCFALIPANGFPEGPAGNTEEVREQREVQRMYITFLQMLALHQLVDVLRAPPNAGALPQIIASLLDVAASSSDILLRKASIGIFMRLVTDWCPAPEKVAGFRQFVIERFAPECCLYSLLRPSFDLGDANTVALFGDIVAAQKMIYQHCGNEFLVHWATLVLPAVHCPPNTAEQYCLHLQRSDLKVLREFLRVLVLQLQPHQNGATHANSSQRPFS